MKVRFFVLCIFYFIFFVGGGGGGIGSFKGQEALNRVILTYFNEGYTGITSYIELWTDCSIQNPEGITAIGGCTR